MENSEKEHISFRIVCSQSQTIKHKHHLLANPEFAYIRKKFNQTKFTKNLIKRNKLKIKKNPKKYLIWFFKKFKNYLF